MKTTVLEPSLDRAPVPEASDRSFGFVFAAVFSAVGCWPLYHWQSPRWWAIGIAIVFVIFALLRPGVLHPLNRAWLALGKLLHRIVSPIVMGVTFFLCVTPIGWVMRVLGKDVLAVHAREDLSSYWIKREPSPPAQQSMRNQF